MARSLMIYFGNKLSREDILNDELRSETLRSGVAQIMGNYPEICIRHTFNSACAVMAIGTEETITRLKIFLDSSGTEYAEDPEKIIFRGATR